MKKIAIITGASSGIGLELTKLIGKEDVELLLISRSIEITPELKDLNKTIHTLQMDLTNNFDFSKIDEIILGKEIKYMINNAGFGDFGNFIDLDINKATKMINLNIIALTKLSKYFLDKTKDYKEKAYLLNVASVASFMPGPLMAVYYATKAYVFSFTQAIAYENKNKNIVISALCPGPTKTNFIKSSNLQSAKIFKNFFAMTSSEVAIIAYKNLLKEKEIIVTGILNKIMLFFVKISPLSMVKYFTFKMMKKK